ncbi:hypothetical protein AB0J90_01465 [Micromonospora sp. NPDC049523]|uniref:hypothetical protein n=1 Tax=Micromonospora sp. NPDC049523 TaxID=3155921 RepID=UPI003440E7CC
MNRPVVGGSRRPSWTASVTAVVLLLGATAALWRPAPAQGTPDRPTTTSGTLPDRIGVPVIGTLHVADRPRLGPAAVLFSGRANGLTGGDEDGVVGVVSADADRYRQFEAGFEAPAGEQVLLSPDGRVVVYPGAERDRGCVELVDLVSGDTKCVAGPTPQSVVTVPIGWSGDGSRLVVREMVPVNPERSAFDSVLSIVELEGRRTHQLARGRVGNGPLSYDGFTVAFAPDGRRLAYQMSGRITVTDLDGRQVSSFAVSAGTRLAGKGAWTPDGNALSVVEGEDGAWSLRHVDPATGTPAAGTVVPSVPGVTAIRLLGWHPDGSAVVVAYDPTPSAIGDGTAYDNVRTIRVLALTPGAAAPATLLTAPDQVLAIDVADGVVRGGVVRSADPPSGVGPWLWFWAGLVGAAVALYVSRRRWMGWFGRLSGRWRVPARPLLARWGGGTS